MELTHVIFLITTLCPQSTHKGALELAPLIQENADRYSIPAEIAVSVMVHESSCRLHKRGKRGEVGPFQILPEGSAARGHSIPSLKVLSVNVKLGISHISKCSRRCKGKTFRGLSIYNGHKSCIESKYSKAVKRIYKRISTS